MAGVKARIPGIACPHCGEQAVARSSEAVTELCRTLRYRCKNDDCGHDFVAQLAIIHTVRPSLRPNPLVRLPLSPSARPKAAANDVIAIGAVGAVG